jgi:hypothetical protein
LTKQKKVFDLSDSPLSERQHRWSPNQFYINHLSFPRNQLDHLHGAPFYVIDTIVPIYADHYEPDNETDGDWSLDSGSSISNNLKFLSPLDLIEMNEKKKPIIIETYWKK